MEVSADNVPAHRIRLRDAAWLFAFPAYQIIGTLRHEGSHALAVLLEGGKVERFVFWPTFDRDFYWGYVQWSGHADWLVSAAPYLADLLTFAVFYVICTKIRIRRHGPWVNLFVIGLLSPFINSAYRYASSFFRDGDLTRVYAAVPAPCVHAYFIVTLALYVAGMARIQRSGREPHVLAAPPSPDGSHIDGIQGHR
ncbi:MAG TPA: hypothetical protein VL500_04260 [Candidatus Eisenbacteria bacterium]|nr:hypothetical protein [Candidatus Eisenbacteria bacterium]